MQGIMINLKGKPKVAVLSDTGERYLAMPGVLFESADYINREGGF